MTRNTAYLHWTVQMYVCKLLCSLCVQWIYNNFSKVYPPLHPCLLYKQAQTRTHVVMSTWPTNFYSFTLIYSLKSLDTASSHSPAVTIQMREHWFSYSGLWLSGNIPEDPGRYCATILQLLTHRLSRCTLSIWYNSVTFDTASLKSGLTSYTEFTLNQTSNQAGFRMKQS